MDVVGSEIGQKMRSAIKAKLTELGCYVDDELPDYVMVMVANKRTRSQMTEDLQLFLGANTPLFVNWLHQVLKKLQEVTVSTTSIQSEKEEVNQTASKAKPPKPSTKPIKEKKSKEKKEKKASKEKHKKSDGSIKKSKKESKKKDKESRKKVPKKSKKIKKHDNVIRLNVPPLLMNLEKDSEPSITDVFAGQILKNHGITLEKSISEDTKSLEDIKPLRKALKRNRFPIIDPETVSNITDAQLGETVSTETTEDPTNAAPAIPDETPSELTVEAEPIQTSAQKAMQDLEKMPREEQIREMNEIEAKIQGLKMKLADQMDSMSEDEDFLNIRTEAEELMNDFAEDVLQEISAAQKATGSSTPPLSVPATPATPTVAPVAAPSPPTLPHIELQLPKRPLRDRLGVRVDTRDKKTPERTLPERRTGMEERRSGTEEQTEERGSGERERRRHVDLPQRNRDEFSKKSITTRSVTRQGGGGRPASVVHVRPRPRNAAAAPALLMRAVADAHKSLLNIAPKPNFESQVKRALVLPMRRNMDSQNIVIQVQTERRSPLVTHAGAGSQEGSDCEIDLDTESLTGLTGPSDKPSDELLPELVAGGRDKHAPSHASDSSTFEDDVIKIHNSTAERERGPQFVVTLDGLDPNIFLAKKLKTEGLSDGIELRSKKQRELDDATKNNKESSKTAEKSVEVIGNSDRNGNSDTDGKSKTNLKTIESKTNNLAKSSSPVKRKLQEPATKPVEVKKESPPAKKRKASPIIFDVKEKAIEIDKIEQVKEKEREKERNKEREREKEVASKRERKESVGSDITVTTTASSHKYDSIPALPATTAVAVDAPPCRSFPACRFGATCMFRHPRCKSGALCTRPRCIYWHPPQPPPRAASQVVPVANYKSITATPIAAPAICRYYPACVNPACPFLHPKPCRYGRACLNRAECNFFHHDAPSFKWRSANV